jgi:outer membrane receptor protein involved in Fe transport
LIDPATGFVRVQDTNDAGYFSFERVASRTYTLRVSKQGFRATEVKAIEVTSGKVTSLGNVRLEVGATGETVEVEASAAPLVQAENPQITGTYSNKTLTENVFGFFGLDAIAFLTPGVLPGAGNINTNAGVGASGFGDQTGTASSISANGLRARSNNFTVDGQSANDITVSGPGIFIGNIESVAEYQITTNQFNADQGRNLGATINIITKSGTNDVHGSVYWFHQNAALNSTRALEDRFGDSPAHLVYNEAGFGVGGPVIKNKLFFFGGFRLYRNPGSFVDGETSNTRSITDAGVATLQAAFPGSVTLANYAVFGPLQNPAGNPRCQNGTTVLLTFAAVPNVEACRVERDVPNSDEIEDFNARLDWVGKRQSMYGRYVFQDETFCCTGGDGVDIRSGYFVAVPSRAQLISVVHTYQISPRQLNEFRFGYSRLLVLFDGGSTFPISDNSSNLSRITMPTGFRSFGLATNIPQGRIVNDFQFQDNWSLVHGRHTIKAGIDVRRDRTIAFFLPAVNGSYGFSAQARFANNQPTSFVFSAGDFTYYPFETDQFYYVQDDFRIRPNLTLNVGLRYEHTGNPVNGIHDETVARESDPSRAFWLQTLPLDRRVYPHIPSDNNNWGPRIGFAYTPRWGKAIFGEDKTVIRGGYAIAYEVAFYNILLNTSTSAPRVFSFSNTCSAFNAALCPPVLFPANGFNAQATATLPLDQCAPFGESSPVLGLTTLGCDHDNNAATSRITFNQTFTSEDFHAPYVQNWTLGIQREIGRSSVLEVRYVGNQQVGQFTNLDANPQVPFYLQGAGFESASSGGGLSACPAGTIRTADFATFETYCISTTGVTNIDTAALVPGVGGIPGHPELVPSNVSACTSTTSSGFNGINCAANTAGRLLVRDNSGRSKYHALQTRFDVRNWKNQLTGGLGYSWSHNIDNGSEILGGGNFANTIQQNVFDTAKGIYGDASIDIRHAFTFYGAWDVPVRRDQKGAVGKALGGWQVSASGFVYGGRPYTPVQFFSGGTTGAAVLAGGRNPFCAPSPRFQQTNPCLPHLGNPNAPEDTVGIYAFVNGTLTLIDFAEAFNDAGNGIDGDFANVPVSPDQVHWIINNAESILAGYPLFGIGKHQVRGDNTRVMNMGIYKNTYVGSENQVNIQFRFQMVNVFNHRNFGRGDNFIDDAGIGFAIHNANDAAGRIGIFGLRVIF